MNIGIIIYSQTGNTLLVAQKVEDALKAKGHTVTIAKVEAEIIGDRPIEKLIAAPDSTPYDTIIFAAPVHAFSLAPAMKLYFAQISSLEGKKVYCFVTQHLKKAWMGGNRSLRQVNSACKAKGGEAIPCGIVHWSSDTRDAQIDDIVNKLSAIY